MNKPVIASTAKQSPTENGSGASSSSTSEPRTGSAARQEPSFQLDKNLLRMLVPAEKLRGPAIEIIGVEGLKKLAMDCICPHYVITNPVNNERFLRFKQTEVNKWFYLNQVQAIEGKFEQQLTFLKYTPIAPESKVPIELMSVKGLCELPMSLVNTPPGIYFLCLDGVIQYVGKSVNVNYRVCSHVSQKSKRFDSIFYIQCALDHLDKMEQILITTFMPPLNYTGKPGKNKWDCDAGRYVYDGKKKTLDEINKVINNVINTRYTPCKS